MQFLALIYEDEARFAQGYDEAEFAEYGVFGKKHAGAIKGGNALSPPRPPKPCASATAKPPPPTAHSPKPKSSSAATICLKLPQSTRPPKWHPRFRGQGSAPSRFAPSWSSHNSHGTPAPAGVASLSTEHQSGDIMNATSFPAISCPELTPEQIAKASRHLMQTRDSLLESVSGLSAAQWEFKPAPDRWSIAEVLEHIILIETAIVHNVRATMEAPLAPPEWDRPKSTASS